VKARVQGVSNKLYNAGKRHVAGQHSLTFGEAICVVIAGVMVFMPDIWKKIPVVGKYGSHTAAFVVMLIGYLIW
jgi:hypothetical protein